MNNSIQVHAHEVLHLIGQNSGLFDVETLPQKIREVFGMEATFYACSAADMNAEDLLRFLLRREKITEVEGRLYLNRANICQH